MYEVETGEMPERTLLCRKRSVDSEQAVWAFGKEFVGLLKERPLPPVAPGREGAVFQIYYGEVSEDSDGPGEWCRPVPSDGVRFTYLAEPPRSADSRPDVDFAISLREQSNSK